MVISRVKHEGNSYTYQGGDLKGFNEAVTFFKTNHPHYSDLVQACFKDRLATQETVLLLQALTLTILATQGWEKAISAIQGLSARFQIPLEQAKISISLLEEKWDKMVEYARRYLDLVTQDNKTVWWKLFNSSSALTFLGSLNFCSASQ